MAEEFIELDVNVNADDLADEQFAYIEEGFPGWIPAAGNLDTWILEAGARLASEVGSLIFLVGPEIWRVYGEKIIGLLPIDDMPATGVSTWTLGDAGGYTIEAGTVVSVADFPFEVVNEVVVPPGETVAEGVELIAVDAGADSTGLSGTVEQEDTPGYEAAIVLDAPTEGGQDGETAEDYVDRLARENELLAPRPLTPHDVELFAKRTQGVDRAAVLDNYKPGEPYDDDPEEFDVPLCFTVVPIDSVGQPVSAGTRAVLLASLQANRGINWRIFVIPPVYVIVDVNFEAVAHRDADPGAVTLAGIAALTEYLSPANWGQPQFGDQRKWVNTPYVRHRELAAALDRVEGLDYITLLEFGLPPAALTENVDIELTSAWPAPLPQPGDITGLTVAP